MIISDLITTKEISKDNINTNNWCSCIDGALTKENYLKSIRDAGFETLRYQMRKPIWMKAILVMEEKL